LGNTDGTYYSKAKLPFGLESFDLEALDRLRAERLLPNFETTWQGALFEGLPWRDEAWATFNRYIISMLSHTNSFLSNQVWARGITKKDTHALP